MAKHRLKGNTSSVFVSISLHLPSKKKPSFQSHDCHIPFYGGILTQVSDMEPETSGNMVNICNLPVKQPVKTEGKSSWEAYYAQFTITSQMNHRTEEQKASFLAASLKETALPVLINCQKKTQ